MPSRSNVGYSGPFYLGYIREKTLNSLIGIEALPTGPAHPEQGDTIDVLDTLPD
jgi:hypothetical protein